MSLIEALSIILSIVSLIVTTVGFFASLKFYRDGVQLQQSANDALTKIAEKTANIQTQVGGMFDKTLEAALKNHNMSTSFEELEAQVSTMKDALLAEVRGQIGEAGNQQQQQIKETVENQIRLLSQKVESTRESAEAITDGSKTAIYNSDLRLQILKILASSPNGLSQFGIIKLLIETRFAFMPTDVPVYLKLLRDGGYVHTAPDMDKFNITIKGRDLLDRRQITSSQI
ncbi:MAG: hypothetical protein WBV94_02770 [Blastocatellia bacterium]